jgi:hypothetical protein
MYCGRELPAESETKTEEKKPARIDPAEKVAGAVSRERIFLVVSPLGAEPTDSLVDELSELMGWDRYLARMKLRCVVPYVLAASEDPQKLQDLTAGLGRLGLDAFFIKETGLARLETKLAAYSAVAEQDRIIFNLEDDSQKPVNFSELFLMVRGRVRLGFALSRKLGKLEMPDMDQDRGKIFDLMIKSRRDKKKRKFQGGNPEAGETGTEMEVLDIYCRNEHAAVRVVESEFDFSGLFGPGFQARLVGVKKFRELLRSSAPEMIVDDTFIKAGYAYRERPLATKQSRRFARSGMAKSREKLHSIQAMFTEHSGMAYLYFLRKKMESGKK